MSLRVMFRDFNEARGTFKYKVFDPLVANAHVSYSGLWVTHTNGDRRCIANYVEGDTSLDDGWLFENEFYSDVMFTSVER